MRGVNPLKYFPLDEGVVEIPPKLEEWLRYWWGYSIKKMRPNDWFGVEGDNLFCTPAPATAETVIELLLENRLQHLYLYHTIVVPRLMIFLLRKHTGKEADQFFNVPVGTYFWTLEEYEPLIIALPPLPPISHRNGIGTRKIKGSKWESGKSG